MLQIGQLTLTISLTGSNVTLILITYKIICSAANDGHIAISPIPFPSITNPAQRHRGWQAH